MAPNCFRSPCRISGMGIQKNKLGSERASRGGAACGSSQNDSQDAPGEIAALRDSTGLRLWLAGKHDVVPVAEDKNLRRAPNNVFQFDHGAHAQSKLPQQ